MADGQRITKLAAAQRQIRAAIHLMFDGGDLLAVHTLAGAASIIYSDLVERKNAKESWDRLAQDANKLTPSEYFGMMREPQNFLKHARDDADGEFTMVPDHTESVIFVAIMNASVLGELGMEESVFKLWYIASYTPEIAPEGSLFKEAVRVFGDLQGKPHHVRVRVGRQVLSKMLNDGR